MLGGWGWTWRRGGDDTPASSGLSSSSASSGSDDNPEEAEEEEEHEVSVSDLPVVSCITSFSPRICIRRCRPTRSSLLCPRRHRHR